MARRKVLFVCTGNTCRSQMAEAIVNARRGDTWEAVSAGTHPGAEVNPNAIQALHEIGIQPQGLVPKHFSVWVDQPFDLVITVCDDAAEICPVWPGQGRKIHVGFRDPAMAVGTDEEILAVYRMVRDDIAARILPLLDEVQKEGERLK